jgi:glucose-1-phosphate cytidylyltransferase
MVHIGYRPILWHVMKYYAHFGHKRFVLCLGYRAEMIKNYFLNYSEALSNDFVLTNGGREIDLLNHDIQDWEISFVFTGMHSNIGERLRAVKAHLEGEEYFLANYGDVLTDAPLPDQIRRLKDEDKTASFLCVRPNYTFHLVDLDANDRVRRLQESTSSDIWINGGYFAFRHDVFDYIGDGEDLVEEPFARLIERNQLIAQKHHGFWAPMDTLKDKQNLENLLENGKSPWRVWELSEGRAAVSDPSPSDTVAGDPAAGTATS